MGIRQVTPQSEIMAATERQVMAFRNIIKRRLAYIGEQAVNEARLHHTYTDQTGNLSASIGYAVFDNGKTYTIGDFNPVKKSDTGPEDGRSFAESLAAEFPTGIVLVVVAGMNYAKYVAARGYNVLDSSEILAKNLVKELVNGLKS